MRPPASGLATAFGLLLLGTLVAGAALEAALHLVGYHPPLQSEWMLRSPYLTPSDDVVMIPKVLLEPALYDSRDDRPLILTIGDSFTQGYPVDPVDAYPAVLERLLAGRGVRARVVNAGMGDSGPDQQLRLLTTRLLPRLHPTVVVWSLFVNDLWDNVLKAVYTLDGDRLVPLHGSANWISVRQRLFELPLLPAWIRDHSYTFHLVLKATELLPRTMLPRAYATDPPAWGARKLRRELEELDRLASTRHFRTYLLLIAPQSAYLAAADPDAWETSWTGVEYRKLTAVLAGRPDVIDAWLGAAHASDAFAEEARDVAALGERHFNERGYALLAAMVAERIVGDRALTVGGSSR
jgi:lysophospholipase L1-like esterase